MAHQTHKMLGIRMLRVLLLLLPLTTRGAGGQKPYKRRDQMSAAERVQSQDEIADQIAEDIKCQL